jgi:hypothetical protein
MASKYTKDQVVTERRCGLKYFDKAVELVGRPALLQNAFNIAKAYPEVWGRGWSNFGWAIGNAVIEAINPKGDIAQTWNLDEALTPEEIANVKTTMGYQDEYKVVWERRAKAIVPRKKG